MAFHNSVENVIHALRYRQVQQHLRPGKRMVDLGCGETYRFLKKFHHMADECWGLDVSMTDGRDGNVFLRRFDITEKLPFADGAVDLITCLAVLEHLEEPTLIFRECRRILTAEGRMIITTPSRTGIVVHDMLRVLKLVQDVKADEHKDFRMTTRKLSLWIQEAGLCVQRLRTFEWGLNILLVVGR